MALPVDLNAIREARKASAPAEVDVNVTVAEIEKLLTSAENLDWDRISMFKMLEWAEEAVDIFQRLAGHTQRNLVG